MRNNKFESIKALFISYFEEETNRINADFDCAHCNAYARFPPDDPEYGSFDMYIDCALKRGNFEGADNVSLGIIAYDHSNKFVINSEICWGDPSGKIEASIFEEPVEVNEENLAVIQGKLPELVSKLRELIRDNSKVI